MSEFRMPALGADMEAGTLAESHVKVGDRVRSGDIVAVVETQRAPSTSKSSSVIRHGIRTPFSG